LHDIFIILFHYAHSAHVRGRFAFLARIGGVLLHAGPLLLCLKAALHVLCMCWHAPIWQVSLAAGTEQLPEKLIALREALAGAAAAAAVANSSADGGSSSGSSDESSSGGANVSQLVARHPQLLRHAPQQLQALVQQVRPRP
jgi:hypothetical protein